MARVGEGELVLEQWFRLAPFGPGQDGTRTRWGDDFSLYADALLVGWLRLLSGEVVLAAMDGWKRFCTLARRFFFFNANSDYSNDCGASAFLCSVSAFRPRLPVIRFLWE